MDKQKLEEARQLAMSMTSHPVAFGTIEHTERAGELLAELVKANEALAREAYTWSKAAETYATGFERLRGAALTLRGRLLWLDQRADTSELDALLLGPNVRGNAHLPAAQEVEDEQE